MSDILSCGVNFLPLVWPTSWRYVSGLEGWPIIQGWIATSFNTVLCSLCLQPVLMLLSATMAPAYIVSLIPFPANATSLNTVVCMYVVLVVYALSPSDASFRRRLYSLLPLY